MSARILGKISSFVPWRGDLAVGNHHDLVGQVDDALLVGDDEDGGLALALAAGWKVSVSLAKDHRSMPASGSSKISRPAVAGQNGGDLDALDLAAGEGGVHLPVYIIGGAQADPVEVLEQHSSRLRFSVAGGQGQQVPDPQALKAGGLLEAVADAQLGPLGDGKAW